MQIIDKDIINQRNEVIDISANIFTIEDDTFICKELAQLLEKNGYKALVWT